MRIATILKAFKPVSFIGLPLAVFLISGSLTYLFLNHILWSALAGFLTLLLTMALSGLFDEEVNVNDKDEDDYRTIRYSELRRIEHGARKVE